MQEKRDNRLAPGLDYMVDVWKLPNQTPGEFLASRYTLVRHIGT